MPPILPCLVSAKCELRLQVASVAYHYYESIGREHAPQNMHCTNTLKSFYAEWEALVKLKEGDKPDVPTLHENATPLKWLESFKDCACATFGIRMAPVSCLLRENEAVPDEDDDPLLPNKAHGESGSTVDELIKRLDYSDGPCKTDNATLHAMLETATRGTTHAPTIASFSRRKDGRGAWQALVLSHAGVDKWEKLCAERSRFLMNTKWNGRACSLEKFAGLHRNACVNMTEAASHIAAQLPTEHARVGYLLDNIENNDPDLKAVISNR